MKYQDTEISNTITAYFNQCLEIEGRLSSLASHHEFKDSNNLKGLYSIHTKQLYDERVRLFGACNMFKKFITPSPEVSNYMVDNVQEVNVLDFWNAGEEFESDEDDDNDSDVEV